MFPIITAIIGLVVGLLTSPNPAIGLICGGMFGMIAWALTGFKVGSTASPIPESAAEQTGQPMAASSREQWYLQQTEILLAPIAQAMHEDVKPLALDLLQKTKAEATARHGNNIYTETLGDQIIDKQSAILSTRLAAGLTIDDVRSYWNQPMLMQLLQVKVLELVDFITVDVAQQSGKDPAEVVRTQRKTQPRYGDPDAWDSAHPVNTGFTADDADIYPEFRPRVIRWESAVTAPVRADLIAQYSSYNAMVRGLIRQGLL